MSIEPPLPLRRAWPALRAVLAPAALPLVALLLFLPGGAVTGHGADTGSPPVPTLTLTRADNGNAVDVPVGGRLVVRLDENPATGYRWALETTDAEVVTLQHVEYVPSHDAGVGGGGQRTWTFIARTPKVASLHLKLWRAWEGDTSITRRFTVTLHVHE